MTDSWLSILGSIASIGGAIYAYYQALQSRKYATEAQVLRDEFLNRRKLVEVSRVHAETNRILDEVSKIGPTCTAASVIGIKVSDIAHDVEKYAQFLKEQSSHFSDQDSNHASKLCTSLYGDIETLAETCQFEEIKSSGKRIYYKLLEFLPIAKSLTDETKEQNFLNNH